MSMASLAEHSKERLATGVVVENLRRVMGRPVWSVLWSYGTVSAEYDRELEVIE